MLFRSFGKNGSTFDYEGEWMGNRKLDRPDLDEVMRYTLGRVTLSVKDRHFELSSAGVPTAGKIDFTPDHAELTIDTTFERPAERQHPKIKLTPQPDGSVVLDDPESIDSKPVKLVRQKAS
jgi:hypothetical protein